MKTIIVGLGNPILGDDGVGWRVVEEVIQNLPNDISVGIECLSVGGLGLMEHLIGYDRAIIVDSFIMDAEDVGSILIRTLNELPRYSGFHVTSVHDTSLQTAIQLGRHLGAYLPAEILIVGIAIQPVCEFSEVLSTPVAETVLPAAHIVLNFLKDERLMKKENLSRGSPF